MEIYEHVAGSVVVFELRGRLTLESFGRLKHRVRTLVELGGDVWSWISPVSATWTA